MNESWHIPRASLAGSSTSASSSNSSNKSHSNPSTVTRHSRQLHHHLHQEGHSNLAYVDSERMGISGNGRGDGRHGRNLNNLNYEIFLPSGKLLKTNVNDDIPTSTTTTTNTTIKSNDGKNAGLKRGSRSSQGSTDSNSSTHSASSGSLLLTTANLERFAAIHKQQQKLDKLSEDRQNYNTNIAISQQKNTDNTVATTKNNDTVIEIDPNLHFVKTKDVDSVSIASSTHFTVVNGIGGPPKKIKEGLCSRGHQVTVLIVSMSFFFLIGISTMVYLLEMRAREMPQ